MPDEEVLTVAELARRWHFHPMKIRRLIRDGTLTAYNFNPGGIRPVYRIPLVEVERVEATRHDDT